MLQPQQGIYNESYIEQLRWIVDTCAEHGIHVFLVRSHRVKLLFVHWSRRMHTKTHWQKDFAVKEFLLGL